jgi:hypothetical protein
MGLDQIDGGTSPPIRYIKLGRNNAWAKRALTEGELPFGHKEVPHDLALTGDAKRIYAHVVGLGRTPGTATSFTREVMAFYGLDTDAIWVTFADGQLWWASADSEVHWLGETPDYAPRVRRTVNGWHNHDALGRPLLAEQLSTKLTKVASFRQTICKIDAEDYLRRKLAGEEEPLVRRAKDSQTAIKAVVEDMIAHIHWGDFETMIDIILGRSGFHRVSRLGKTLKDADLVVEHALTGETIFVQVKSASTQAEFDRYVDVFDENPFWARMIYVCHTAARPLEAPTRDDVLLWNRQQLAEVAIRNGMFDWLIARVA